MKNILRSGLFTVGVGGCVAAAIARDLCTLKVIAVACFSAVGTLALLALCEQLIDFYCSKNYRES